jgi:hypothetical protein
VAYSARERLFGWHARLPACGGLSLQIDARALRFGTSLAVFVVAITVASCAPNTTVPSLGPIPTPTPTPFVVPAALIVSPTSLPISGTGIGNAGSATVQESGYGGTFSEHDTCTGIATVTTSSASGPSATFTVTGVAAGSCSATFSDSNSQQVSTSIAVTTNGFGVDAHARGGAR